MNSRVERNKYERARRIGKTISNRNSQSSCERFSSEAKLTCVKLNSFHSSVQAFKMVPDLASCIPHLPFPITPSLQSSLHLTCRRNVHYAVGNSG